MPTAARERQRVATRERLFTAALDEFRERGFAGAQIDRIAAAAGVVRGTFYFHFPTKDHVLLELQLRAQERLAEVLRALPEDASLREILNGLDRGIAAAEDFVDAPELMRDVVVLYVRPLQEDEFLSASLPVLQLLAERLRHLQERGGLHPELGPGRAAELMLTSLLGRFARAAPDRERRRVEVRELIDVLARGLAPEPEAP